MTAHGSPPYEPVRVEHHDPECNYLIGDERRESPCARCRWLVSLRDRLDAIKVNAPATNAQTDGAS